MKRFHPLFTAGILLLTLYSQAFAHCDTLDGPVIQDARKALAAKDVTPVLKWIKEKDEKAVRAAFDQTLAAQNTEAQQQFFATLVKIHRAGEGAPFTGLKPAGAVEPAVAAADRALASQSDAALLELVNAAVTAGIQERFARAAAAYWHKDESVTQGRAYVEAYIEFTHYVERLHLDATASGEHGVTHAGEEPPPHAPHKHGHGH